MSFDSHIKGYHLVFVVSPILVLLRLETMIFGLFALTHDFGTVHLASIPRVVEKELRLDGGTADDAEKDPGAEDERHNF